MLLGFPLLAGLASISSVIVEMRHGAGGVRDLRDIGVTRFDVENAARDVSSLDAHPRYVPRD